MFLNNFLVPALPIVNVINACLEWQKKQLDVLPCALGNCHGQLHNFVTFYGLISGEINSEVENHTENTPSKHFAFKILPQ